MNPRVVGCVVKRAPYAAEPTESICCLSSLSASTLPLRIWPAMSGASSLNSPPGFGAMTSFTRVPAPSSVSFHQPEGSIEPGPAFAGGPCQASLDGGSNSVPSLQLGPLPSCTRSSYPEWVHPFQSDGPRRTGSHTRVGARPWRCGQRPHSGGRAIVVSASTCIARRLRRSQRHQVSQSRSIPVAQRSALDARKWHVSVALLGPAMHAGSPAITARFGTRHRAPGVPDLLHISRPGHSAIGGIFPGGSLSSAARGWLPGCCSSRF